MSRSDGLLGWQTITGLRNGLAYEVQVAPVNSVGAGAWTEMRGVPEAPQVGAPPPQPEGDQAFDVGTLGVRWEGTDPNGNFWGNNRTMDSCAGTYAFSGGERMDERRYAHFDRADRVCAYEFLSSSRTRCYEGRSFRRGGLSGAAVPPGRCWAARDVR